MVLMLRGMNSGLRYRRRCSGWQTLEQVPEIVNHTSLQIACFGGLVIQASVQQTRSCYQEFVLQNSYFTIRTIESIDSSQMNHFLYTEKFTLLDSFETKKSENSFQKMKINNSNLKMRLP